MNNVKLKSLFYFNLVKRCRAVLHLDVHQVIHLTKKKFIFFCSKRRKYKTNVASSFKKNRHNYTKQAVCHHHFLLTDIL